MSAPARARHVVRRGLAAVTAVLMAASAPRAATAQRPEPPAAIAPVVSTEWLTGELGRPDLVILQFGGAESFAKARIPGAVALDYERDVLAPAAEGALRVELPAPEALQATLRAKGITPTSRVVIVFDQPATFARAGRTFFTLEWAGLAGRVAVLDGGLPKWVREARAVETGPARPVTPSTSLVLAPETHRKATKDDVVAMIGKTGMRIVDARDAVFYRDERDNQMPRGGHIASAVSLPFSAMTNADGTLRPRAELEELVRAAGIGAEETVVSYCHIGVQGSWLYLALRLLDRDVRMYDGSFDEWSRDAALPVEGAKPRP